MNTMFVRRRHAGHHIIGGLSDAEWGKHGRLRQSAHTETCRCDKPRHAGVAGQSRPRTNPSHRSKDNDG